MKASRECLFRKISKNYFQKLWVDIRIIFAEIEVVTEPNVILSVESGRVQRLLAINISNPDTCSKVYRNTSIRCLSFINMLMIIVL